MACLAFALWHGPLVLGQALWSDTSIQPFDSAPCVRGNPIQVYNKGSTYYEVVQLDLDTGEYSNLFTLDYFSSGDIINSVDLLLADGEYYAFGSVWQNSEETFCRFDENNVLCFDTPLLSRSSVGAIIGNNFYYGRGKLEYWIKDINTDNPTFGTVSARIDNSLYESTVVDVTEILESGLEMIDDGDPSRNYLVGLGQEFEVFVMRLDSNGEYQDYFVIQDDRVTVDWNGQTPETGTSGFGAAYSYRDGRGGQRVFFTANEGWGLFELSLPITVPDSCWNDVTTNPNTHAECGSATAMVTWRTPSVRTSNNDGMNCHQNTLVLPGETPVPTWSPTPVPSYSPTPTPTAVAPVFPAPTETPTPLPTESPAASPSMSPTESPTTVPTISPTPSPTATPSSSPTVAPSSSPTVAPSSSPTVAPSYSPTVAPSSSPSAAPSSSPTASPTRAPTEIPTLTPTTSPTFAPTGSPTTYCAACSNVCSASPTFAPTTVPTRASFSPTSTPSMPTAQPTWGPTLRGSNSTESLTQSLESDENATALLVPLVYVTDESTDWSLCIPLIILALILGWCLGICCVVRHKKSKRNSPDEPAKDEKDVEAGKSFWDNISTNSVVPDPTALPDGNPSSVYGIASSNGGKSPVQNAETQTGTLDVPEEEIAKKDCPELGQVRPPNENIHSRDKNEISKPGPLQDEMSVPNLPISDPLQKNEDMKLIHSSSMPSRQQPQLNGPVASEVSPRYCDPNDVYEDDGKSQLSCVYVGTPAGNTVLLNVRLTPNGDTVADVKSQLKSRNVALKEPRLIFRSELLANESQPLVSCGVQNESFLQLEGDDDFQFEGRANALQKQHIDLVAAIKRIESDLKSVLESGNEMGADQNSPLDIIIREADHLLRDSTHSNVPLEARYRDLVRAHADTTEKLQNLKGTKSNLSRAEANTQLSALEVKTLEQIAESQRIANDVEKVCGAKLGEDKSCEGRCKVLQLELDKAREEIEKINSPAADLSCEGKCAKLQAELTLVKNELDELKSEMIRASLSVKMPPTLNAPLKQEAFQLSPRAEGVRGFKMNWERNGNMEPLRRLEQAQFHIKHLDPTDLQKPEGAPLPYLESALKRAAILTSSPGDEVSDVWSYPVQERAAAIEPEEAKGVFDRVALAKEIPVYKDEATLSSEFANVAETIEEFNQALINESNISHVVETITESRRAVLEIRRGNIDEIRSLNYPPPMVENILLSVMTIINDDSRKGGWKEMKRRMTKGSLFLREIFEFDATAILPKHVKDTKKIFASHPEDFNPEVITQKGSAALPPLFKWVQTMIYFHDSFKDVPLGLKEHILERVRAAYADFVEDVSLERAISSRRRSRGSSFASSIGSSRASSRSNSRSNSRPNSASEHSSQMRKKSMKERANLGRKSITYERDEYGRIIKDENNSIESILATSH